MFIEINNKLVNINHIVEIIDNCGEVYITLSNYDHQIYVRTPEVKNKQELLDYIDMKL